MLCSMQKICLLLILFVNYSNSANNSNTIDHHRDKRNLPLVFPVGGTSKMLLGWAIPISNPVKINLVFGYNIQFQYAIPPNISIFTKYYPYVTVQRKKRDIDDDIRYEKDRLMLYKPIEDSLNRYGINGRECMLRTICEAAEIPIKDSGYVGEIFDLALSPRYDVFNTNNLPNKGDDEYGAARLAGEQLFDCRKLYPKCPMGHGLFDLMSIVEK